MADKILFRQSEDFSEFLSGQYVLDLKAIQPSINDAVDRFIIPLIGEETVNIAIDAYGEETDMSETEEKLYNHIAKAAIHLALAIGYADLNVRLTAGGIGVSTGENMAIASGERVRQYAEARALDGQIALDALVKYLEANTDTDTFNEYLESPERKRNRQHFVNTPDEMNVFVMPGVLRWAFMQMKPSIKRVEDTIIKHILCADLYDHLKELIESENATPDFGAYTPLIPLIQDAVSNLAMAVSFDRLGLKVDTVNGVYQSFYKNSNEPLQSKPLQASDLSPIAARYNADGNKALEALKLELQTNVENYPLYKESTCYTEPKENYTTNETDNGIAGAVFFGF